MEALTKLQRWYESQCDGDWEHHHGISIETCDNPGWWVKISLAGTPLEFRTFEPIAHGTLDDAITQCTLDDDGGDWLRCYIEDGRWHGAGRKLPAIINPFLRWVDSSE